MRDRPPPGTASARVRAGHFTDDGELFDERDVLDEQDVLVEGDRNGHLSRGGSPSDEDPGHGPLVIPAAERRGRSAVAQWLSERLPMSLRTMVATPTASATLLLALVALTTAIMATWLAWRHRPVPVAAPASASSVVIAAPASAGVGPSPRAEHPPGSGTGAAGGAAGPSGVAATPGGVVVVDVAGRVVRPGVVRLPVGARVVDALDRVGGVLPGTDTTGIALARVLIDGEQVLVDGRPGPPAAAVSAPAAKGGAAAGSAGAAAGAPGGPLDLNSASAEQLDGLPGVGPVLAQRIVDWRTEHGPFRSPEQLGEVTGVGDRRLADLLPLVKV